MTTRKIQVGSLEFDEIKQNLKDFLKAQSQFSDYDFEGSNLSILLDVLAYNTYYNNVYTNMAINEAFLDTASKRSSVVSRATELGYLPRSARCATTNVSFVVSGVNGNPDYLVFPKKATFQGVKDSVRYTFYTTEDVTADKVDNEYTFTDIAIYEGFPVTNRFLYTDEVSSFVLENQNIDTTTLVIRVQKDGTTQYENYALANDLSNVDGTSLVYFMRETEGGYYEITFGDDVLGKALVSGQIVYADYFVSNGEAPNGISSLTYTGISLDGGSLEELVMDAATSGGRLPETIEEIRFNAPNFYASQNRVVTGLDYETLILNKVPSIEAVTVWGGETNNPPIYGKVFISAKTVTGQPLTYAEQEAIISGTLDNYKIVSVIPEFIQPEYLEVELDVVVYYDQTLTNKTAKTIQTDVVSALLYFDELELQKFNRILRQSVVSRTVEEVDISIVSCVPRMKMHRTVTPVYNVSTNYYVNIGNPFTPSTILSTAFYVQGEANTCYIDDDGAGTLRLYKIVNGIRQHMRNCGTVDYSTGVLSITSINIVKLGTSSFRFAITPSSADVVSIFNQIVQLDTSLLKVNMIADETTKGRVLKGNKFQFTTSKI